MLLGRLSQEGGMKPPGPGWVSLDSKIPDSGWKA